ncbi:HemK2/MTQ2 family protein methyltransferase [Methanobacterium paludis]|uniref:Methylase n=1 Tax=Methanobacterium paludis (strain DSM 25820 / JCM 18151 / SWAN1) TaxID=868131 RepID=F6D5E7_METPW|nr:HemK2/MTQ2 family protein methyltransferase [Methanobacterium paludis]AEG19299.1 methylase [Methanobacterium paludis]
MIKYNEMEFQTHLEVYEPAEDTFLFLDNLNIKENDYVLEIGPGTGIISIIASKTAENVVAVDINPHAVECTRKNAEHNKAFNIGVREGDLFDPVKGEKFDLILFNTPYLPTGEDEKVDDQLEAAWDGGEEGRETIDRFLDELYDHLKPHGRVQMVQSSLSDIPKTLKRLEEMGFEAAVTASEHYFFEEVVVITGTIS